MLRTTEGTTCVERAEERQDEHMQKLLMKLMTKGDAPFRGKHGDDPELGKEVTARQRILDRKGMWKSMFKDKAAQKFFPIFWIICLSLTLFEYLVDIRATGYQVAPTASFLYEVGIPMTLVFFAWVALTDPGKLPSRSKGDS